MSKNNHVPDRNIIADSRGIFHICLMFSKYYGIYRIDDIEHDNAQYHTAAFRSRFGILDSHVYQGLAKIVATVICFDI